MEGTYSFTYFGSLGGGLGVMTAERISEHEFILVGHDMLNTRYDGKMCLDPETKEITINFDMLVPANVILVQNTAPQDIALKKTNLQARFPPNFESDAPIKCFIAPGEVYVGVRRVPDTFSGFSKSGFPKQMVDVFYGW